MPRRLGAHSGRGRMPTGSTKTSRPPYQWVIEGDIKGCFDNIDHHSVMVRLRRRVHDVKVTRLVLAFLKAGMLCEDAFLRTNTGTPQGGILSPLLANIVLSAIEERYERFLAHRKCDGTAYAFPGKAAGYFRWSERKKGRPAFLPIRYADECVVLVSGTLEHAETENQSLARFLHEELKLTLSPEKTHVTVLIEGFQFLGHRVYLRWDDRWGYWPRIEIPREKAQDMRYRIKQMTARGHLHLELRDVIDALNPVLLGWGRFYQHCYGAKTIFNRIDHYAWDRLRRWLRKKHFTTSSREILRRYWRRLPDRPRYCWADRRHVALVGHLPVGRHSLAFMRYPDCTLAIAGKPGA